MFNSHDQVEQDLVYYDSEKERYEIPIRIDEMYYRLFLALFEQQKETSSSMVFAGKLIMEGARIKFEELLEKRKREGILQHVYIVQAMGTSFYKIGRTKNLKHRLSNLQTGNPHQLIIYRTILTTAAREVEIIARSRLSEHIHRGEWYEFQNRSTIDDFLESISSWAT